jgi:hypothetical protein
MRDKPRTLTDADISSARFVSRRALLSALGIGAGLAAVVAAGSPAHADTKPQRRDPCRDGDHGPPSDTDGCGRPPIS